MGLFLNAPCDNCPFSTHKAAIKLQPDRVEDLANDIESNDNFMFYCHKTIDYDVPEDDEWDDDVVYSNTLFNFPTWKDHHHEEETVINFIYATFPLKEDLPLLIYEKINSTP